MARPDAGASRRPRGEINTPAFMPVGTAGTVKAMYPEQVRELGAGDHSGQYLSPDAPPWCRTRRLARRIARLHGLARATILTDSGGFQVMSLAKLRKLTEHGVTFRSHIDGSAYELTPERSIEIQLLLDSNIIMQLDECIGLPAEKPEMLRAHGAVAALGRALQNRLWQPSGPCPVRHRPGRRTTWICASPRPRG